MRLSTFLSNDHVALAALQEDLLLALGKGDLPQSFYLLDLFWAKLAIHIRAENVCLFPAIIKAATDGPTDKADLPQRDEVRAVLTGLRNDHNFFMDQLAKAVATMRKLMANPEPALGEQVSEVLKRIHDVAERLTIHNETEESLVYEWPEKLMDELELTKLTRAVTHEVENVPPRFDRS